MGWKRRGNQWYLYRSRRQNGRVVTDYLGTGAVAEAAARLDALERSERQAAKLAARQEFEEYERIDLAVSEFCTAAEDLTAAALVMAGCYCHQSEWRRRRESRGTRYVPRAAPGVSQRGGRRRAG